MVLGFGFRRRQYSDQPRDGDGRFAVKPTDGAGNIRRGVGDIEAVAQANIKIAEMVKAQEEAMAARADARRAEIEAIMSARSDDDDGGPLDDMIAAVLPMLLAKQGINAQTTLPVAPAADQAAPTDQVGGQGAGVIKVLAKLPDKLFTKENVMSICDKQGIDPKDLSRVIKKLSKAGL